MGAYVSVSQCDTHCKYRTGRLTITTYTITNRHERGSDNIQLNCTAKFDNVTREYTQIAGYTVGTFPSNPDIAGIGVRGTCHLFSNCIAISLTDLSPRYLEPFWP